jgi:hypothetical protein
MVDEPRWTVDTVVLQVVGAPPLALRSIQLSLPPAGGSGVEVAGLDPRTVADATIFANGTVQTPTVRLTGTSSSSPQRRNRPSTYVRSTDHTSSSAAGFSWCDDGG